MNDIPEGIEMLLNADYKFRYHESEIRGYVCRLQRQLQEANARVAELEEENKWIDVNDRLPEPETVILTSGSHTHPITAYIEEDSMRCRSYENNEWIVGVTHWMPIPELT